MITKTLDQLAIDDIRALIGVAESRYLDFKSAPVGGADRDRKEFLADVSAFANAGGGDMVFGVTEQDGAASTVPGIAVSNPDEEVRRLSDLIRMGLEPRLTHFDLKWLPMGGTQGALVIRVPRSWIAPHRVTFQGHDKFYIRNSAGKHPMNIDELRRAFAFGQALTERISHFRAERIALVSAAEAPFAFQAGGAKLIVHLVPLTAFADPPDLRLGGEDSVTLQPFGASGWDYRYTLEGFATHAGPRDGSGFVRAYCLAFRSGMVEAAGSLGDERDPLRLRQIELYVMETWKRYLKFAERHRVEPPVYVLLSLLNVRGRGVYIPQDIAIESAPYRRENLVVPPFEVSTEHAKGDPPALFRALFDTLANAFGLPRSYSYRADGSYNGG